MPAGAHAVAASQEVTQTIGTETVATSRNTPGLVCAIRSVQSAVISVHQ